MSSPHLSSPPRVIITGASTGIGREVALQWARRGARLAVCARTEGALDELKVSIRAAGGEAVAVAGDVTERAVREAVVDACVRAFGGIDVLVNNAGRGLYGAVEDLDTLDLEAVFRLNVIAPVALAQRALPHLRASRGIVVMVSSVAGVVAAPRMGGYAASKFALEALSQSLRAEVDSAGVSVVVIRPGPVDTPFRANASVAGNAELHLGPARKNVQSAAAVASRILAAVDRRRAVDETSAFVRAASFAARVLPPLLRAVLARDGDNRRV